MGKRTKLKDKNDHKASKSKSIENKIEIIESIEQEAIEDRVIKKNKKKQNKNTVKDEPESELQPKEAPELHKAKKKCEKQIGATSNFIEESINEIPSIIPINSQDEISTTSEIKKKKKKRKRPIVAEEVINDEDIDKYCDELDEEHNVQYENWVKLIEENLNENKKVKK